MSRLYHWLSWVWILVTFLGLGARTASATSFTLGLSAAPAVPLGALTPLVGPGLTSGELSVEAGEIFTVVLGLDDEDELFSYTVDIRIDDGAEVALIGATHLPCQLSFIDCLTTLDPVTESGRASALWLDPAPISGEEGLPPGFLGLTFQALAPSGDGLADVTIGFLDSQADGITGVGGGGIAFSITPSPSEISFSLVPEPSTAVLVGLGMAGLGAWRPRRRPRARGRQRSAAMLLLGPALFFLGSLGSGDARADSCDDDPSSSLCQCRETLFQGRSVGGTERTKDSQALIDADILCTAAVAADPSNGEARLFRAVTRLLRVTGGNETHGPPRTASFAEMADAFGVTPEGRNLYDWEAKLPENAGGKVALPADSPTGEESQTALVGLLVPAIDASVADLQAITPDAQVVLNESEIEAIGTALGASLTNDENGDDEEIEIDLGDILVIESGFLIWKAQLLLIDALNLDVDLDSYTPILDAIDIQLEVINANVDLAKLRPGAAAALAEANVANRAAAEAYLAASLFIRPGDSVPEGPRWADGRARNRPARLQRSGKLQRSGIRRRGDGDRRAE
jgi:hypothetical protein